MDPTMTEELLKSVGILNDWFSKNALLDSGEGDIGVTLLYAITEGMSFFLWKRLAMSHSIYNSFIQHL